MGHAQARDARQRPLPYRNVLIKGARRTLELNSQQKRIETQLHRETLTNRFPEIRILGPGAERWRLACAATALNSLSVRSCMPDTVCPGLGFGGAEATL